MPAPTPPSPLLGHLVWGKLRGFRHWPGLVVGASGCGKPPTTEEGVTWIFWFADLMVSMVKEDTLVDFAEFFDDYYKNGGPSHFTCAVSQVIQEWSFRRSQHADCPQEHADAVRYFKRLRYSPLASDAAATVDGSQYSPFVRQMLERLIYSDAPKDSLKEKLLERPPQPRRRLLTKKRRRTPTQSQQHRPGHSDSDTDSELEQQKVTVKKSKQNRLLKSILKSSVRDYSKLYKKGSSDKQTGGDDSNAINNKEPSVHSREKYSPKLSIKSDQFGRLVWGKLAGYNTWPGVIVNHAKCHLPPPDEGMLWILWFGDHYVSVVKVDVVTDFILGYSAHQTQHGIKLFRRALAEAIREYCFQRGLSEHLSDSPADLVRWAGAHCAAVVRSNKMVDEAAPWKALCLSPVVSRALTRLYRLRRTRAHSLSPAVSTDTGSDDDSDTKRDNGDTTDEERLENPQWQDKMQQLTGVRAGNGRVEDVCISCVSVTCAVTGQHPLFRGGACSPCNEALASVLQDLGSSMWYCVVCAAPGRLVMCDQQKCYMVYCTECIELLVGRSDMESIVESAVSWRCFICRPYSADTHGLMEPRHDWKKQLRAVQEESQLLQSTLQHVPPPVGSCPKRPLRVLALFDGISTGLVSLQKAGLAVDAYYSSEVDPAALLVGLKHFGDKITLLGDVTKITNEQVSSLCPIDLLIGGSPCNDLSAVNPNRKGLFDPDGTGILFFEYVRILKQLRRSNGNRHLFWLFENVASMPEDFKNTISKHLHREPSLVDARNFTPMSRPRLFWGNLPGLDAITQEPPSTRLPVLNDYIDKVGDREAAVKTIKCVTTHTNSLTGSEGQHWPVRMAGKGDCLWSTEIEQVFGFPKHYTDVGNVGSKERQRLLGKAWSVQVATRLLQPLRQHFLTVTADSTPSTSTYPDSSHTVDKVANVVLSPLNDHTQLRRTASLRGDSETRSRKVKFETRPNEKDSENTEPWSDATERRMLRKRSSVQLCDNTRKPNTNKKMLKIRK